MRPINGYVVCKRRADIKSLDGLIVVGQGAYVKNRIVDIIESSVDEFPVGEVAMLPYHETMYEEAVFECEEIVLIKADRFIGVLDGDMIRPVNGYLKVVKCENDHIRDKSGAIAIHMTDNFIEDTQWVEIIACCDSCCDAFREHIGWFCIAPEKNDGLQRIGLSKEFMLKSDLVQFITDGE